MHKYKYMHGILRRYVLPKDSIFYKAGYILVGIRDVTRI